MSESTDPLDQAQALAEMAGLASPLFCTRLLGGRNNQAFKIKLDDGSSVVLKLYHHDPNDTRNRLKAEWSFLKYVWSRGVQNVPEPIIADHNKMAALIGFVAGEKKKPGEIGPKEIGEAAAFVAAINELPRNVFDLVPGSEACFSFADHIAIVDRRAKRLLSLDKKAPLLDEANRLVEIEIMPAWQQIRTKLLNYVQTSDVVLEQRIPDGRICISPSDFGFHNALLKADGKLTFIDFEYAGRDDPAKLICDFICQPELPVPDNSISLIIDSFSAALGLTDNESENAVALINLYRIKWICIMFNEFQAIGNVRRNFAEAKAREVRCKEQLDKARHALTKLR